MNVTYERAQQSCPRFCCRTGVQESRSRLKDTGAPVEIEIASRSDSSNNGTVCWWWRVVFSHGQGGLNCRKVPACNVSHQHTGLRTLVTFAGVCGLACPVSSPVPALSVSTSTSRFAKGKTARYQKGSALGLGC